MWCVLKECSVRIFSVWMALGRTWTIRTSKLSNTSLKTILTFLDSVFFILKLNLLSFKTKVYSVDIFKMCLPQCENFLQCSLQHFFTWVPQGPRVIWVLFLKRGRDFFPSSCLFSYSIMFWKLTASFLLFLFFNQTTRWRKILKNMYEFKEHFFCLTDFPLIEWNIIIILIRYVKHLQTIFGVLRL